MTGGTKAKGTPERAGVQTRAERQKAALKANMARRKAQARARAAGETDDKAGEDRRDTSE